MYLTTHSAAGLLLGIVFQQPAAAFIGGVASHFLLDIVPHEPPEDLILTYPKDKSPDKQTVRKRTRASLFDLAGLAAVIVLSLNLFGRGESGINYYSGILSGITGGVIPDVVIVSTFFLDNKFLRWFFDFHNKLHLLIPGIRVSNGVTTIYQLILSSIMIIGAYYYIH